MLALALKFTVTKFAWFPNRSSTGSLYPEPLSVRKQHIDPLKALGNNNIGPI